MEIIFYDSTRKKIWDEFVDNSKNGLFLFKRDYMEYHQDRFKDFSLMIYEENKLLALLPANIEGDIVYSHKGLTFGGLILNKKISAVVVMNIFPILKNFLKTHKVKSFYYKAIPYIFHYFPAQEDIYALYRSKADLYRVDLSSVIDLRNFTGFSTGKKQGVRKAKEAGLQVEISDELEVFFSNIVAPTLKDKYQLVPVHNFNEMKLLRSKFPNEIIFYAVKNNNEILGGSVIYLSKEVIHLQYFFSSQNGQKMRSAEFLLDFLIEKYKSEKKYLSFGISSQDDGEVLNEGLIAFKEEFGASGMVHCHYHLNLNE